MKNLIRCFACAMALAACLCAFTACSDHTTYNCEAYDFVAADGSVMNMLNMLNGLTLTLNKDGNTLTHTGAEGINGKTGVSTVRFVKA